MYRLCTDTAGFPQGFAPLLDAPAFPGYESARNSTNTVWVRDPMLGLVGSVEVR